MSRLISKNTLKTISCVSVLTLSLILIEKPAPAAYLARGGCTYLAARCDRVEFEVNQILFRADFIRDSFRNLNARFPDRFPFTLNRTSSHKEVVASQQAQAEILSMLNSAEKIPTTIAVATPSGETLSSSSYYFPNFFGRIGPPEGPVDDTPAVLPNFYFFGRNPFIPPDFPNEEKWRDGFFNRPTGQDAVVNYALVQKVPEPLTIFGIATALGVGAALKRSHNKQMKKS